jgi:7,8-dihydro-6-hydroxymethylpterin-pyrophosphokinase
LPHSRFATLPETLQAALQALDGYGIRVERRSRWYRTAPVPVSDQTGVCRAGLHSWRRERPS